MLTILLGWSTPAEHIPPCCGRRWADRAVGYSGPPPTSQTNLHLRERVGSFRSWPDEALRIEESLALAEEKAERLRRIYANE
jgi:hypothetical protein